MCIARGGGYKELSAGQRGLAIRYLIFHCADAVDIFNLLAGSLCKIECHGPEAPGGAYITDSIMKRAA